MIVAEDEFQIVEIKQGGDPGRILESIEARGVAERRFVDRILQNGKSIRTKSEYLDSQRAATS